MPQVVAFVAAYWVQIMAVAAVVASGYAAIQARNMKMGGDSQFAQQQMVRSSNEPRRGIYGRAMVSGPLMFIGETGTDREWLYLVIAVCGHVTDGCELVKLDDEVVWKEQGGLVNKYKNHVKLKYFNGTQTAADSELVSKFNSWTNQHIGKGISYLRIAIKADQDIFPSGIPNIKMLIRGKPVFDPRDVTQSRDNPASWKYTDNWALCCLDYAMLESGVGATDEEIDLDSFIAAANLSDEFVEYQATKFEKRYTLNGTWMADQTPQSIMESLLSAGSGKLVFTHGVYSLFAGAYYGPATLTLDDDGLRDDMSLTPFTERADICNAVRGTFVDPNNFWQSVDFPPVENAFYREKDKGEYIDHDIDLEMVISPWTAQRLAKLHLEQSRAGFTVNYPAKLGIGLQCWPGRVIRLNIPRLGINKEFEVVDWSLKPDEGVDLVLKETAPEIFDWALGEATSRDITPNSDLPDPKQVPTPSGLAFSAAADSSSFLGSCTWNAPGGNSAYRYRLAVFDGMQALIYQQDIASTQCHLPKIDVGFYTVKVWAINTFGYLSNVAAEITIGSSSPANVIGIDVEAGPLSLTIKPGTAAEIAQTTVFEVIGGQNNVIEDAVTVGTGKEIVWADRHPNTTYYLWARTSNNQGKSAWFGPVQTKTSNDKSAIVDLIGSTFDKYTWFAWADDNQGTGFTTVEALGDGKAYMGIATDKDTASPSGNWQEYKWTKIKTEIPPVFTPEEEAKLDNLMAGKLPFAPDKDMLAAQDALNNPALANNLITALSLLNQGINAPALGGETPASAQAKADAAQNAAINAATASAATLANNARAQAEANAALDALNKANIAKSDAIKINDTLALTNYGDWCYSLGNTCGHNNPYNDAWDGCVFSKLNYHGGALAVATIESLAGASRRAMLGLSSMPLSSASFNDINFAIYADLHNYQVYENGLFKSVLLAKSPEVGDVLSVKYDGSKVYYSINGIVLKEDNAVRDLRLHLKTAFFGTEFNWKNIALSPLSNMMVAFDDATNKANSALLLANAALNARVNEDEALSIDNLLSPAGLPYKKDIIIYGDSNKYYPVVFSYGDQSINRRIKIWRDYSEQGPDDWWIPTHKGQLNIDWFGNFGGWGGAVYFEQLLTHTEMYAELLADAYVFGSGMLYCFMLRGGGSVGAIYHIASDMNVMPTVYYNQDLLISAAGAYAPAPTTSVNHERINSLKIGNSTIGNLLAYSAQFHSLKSKVASFGGLTAETIAASAIATNHLQAGAVTSDKFTADTALIQKLISNVGLFNQLQAQLAVFGGLAANSIAAKAITVDKLDVLSRNLINNFTVTGESTGWSDYPIVNHYHNGTHIWAMEVATYDGVTGQTAFFDIDHTKIYEVNFTFCRVAGSENSMNFLGITSDGGPVEVFLREHGGYSEPSNFYFWNGTMQPGENRRIRSYIVGSEVDVNAVPELLNAYCFCRLAPNCRKVSIRALNYYNNGVLGIDRWIHPSVTVLGGGQISANQLLANSALFDKLKARLGAFGGLTANEIQADTALINKLVGTSGLFNDLVARLAVFGGLTANSIASDAILGRHIKAGEKITSPIIEGGEVRLIGTNAMKIESATPFGPDSLVYWRGPRLLVGGNPDWANIRKSNATRWTDAAGDEYFGGSLSAGVLKTGVTNPDKNPYAASSYPVTIGPFGSNGKAKNVVISFALSAVSQSSSNPGSTTQPQLSWQLQRKIGSGSWGTVSSGVFNGAVTAFYEGEAPAHWEVDEHCNGSFTFTDNTLSTSDFNYRVLVVSYTRFHVTSNVIGQTLTLVSTEQ